MRTGFLFGGAFWGIFLIIWGLLAVLKSIFNLNLPLFRIMFSVLLISIGLRVLLGGFAVETDRNMVLFEEKRIVASGSADNYQILFGRGFVDLSGIPADGDVRIEVNTIFGHGTIKIDPELPLRIRMSAAFGHGKLPDGDVVAFGERTYKSKGFKEGAKYTDVRANVVFGSLEVITE